MALQGYWAILPVDRGFMMASLICPDLGEGCHWSPHIISPGGSRATGSLHGYRNVSSDQIPMLRNLLSFCLYHVFWCPIDKSNDTWQRPQSYEWNLHKSLDTSHVGLVTWWSITVFFIVYSRTAMNSKELKPCSCFFWVILSHLKLISLLVISKCHWFII